VEKLAKPNLLLIIAKQIKIHRQKAGMTQQQLADKCDIFRTYLSRIEGATANPTIMILATIAIHLNITVSELLVESEIS
jgi:transcriptional regulator with XRE-family HTH domain